MSAGTAGGAGPPTGAPPGLPRAEGAAVAVAMAVLAWQSDPSWWLAALVLVAPDLSTAGHALGPGTGAALYNAAHTYPGPALAAGIWFLSGSQTLAAIAASWALHIGFDRALGHGLKDPTAFKDTHLGRLGR